MWLPCRANAVTRPEILCPLVTSSPVVDGDAGDWASIKSRGEGISFYKGDGHAGSASVLGTTICRIITDAADCRVDLWLAHDNIYLYVLAEIQDDDYEPFGSPGSEYKMGYLEDTLHLYVDSTNSMRSGIPGYPIQTQSGYEQFGISTDGNIWGENTDFTNSTYAPAPNGASPDGVYWDVECQVQAVSGGYFYTFEERIALGGKPGKNMAAMTPGNSYGFDAEFCDADYGDDLQGFIWWSSNGSTDAWNYENYWGTMTLEASRIPGDANLNGVVDSADASILASNWQTGPNATWAQGDFNDDGYVNELDATLLAGNWQVSTNAAGTVPEPSAMVLLSFAAVIPGLAMRRWNS